MKRLQTDVPAVRILPMSDRLPGFCDRTIEQVQREFFLGRFVAGGGRFRYCSSGLVADAGTVVLFQFKARVVASATFLRDEPFARPAGGYAGALVFDPATLRIFAPVDADTMRIAWPVFRGFGHVKQRLSPGGYAAFLRRLGDVRSR